MFLVAIVIWHNLFYFLMPLVFVFFCGLRLAACSGYATGRLALVVLPFVQQGSFSNQWPLFIDIGISGYYQIGVSLRSSAYSTSVSL